jgi:peptidoglycan hydrolase-like protein with peptidoglycan-binding domain
MPAPVVLNKPVVQLGSQGTTVKEVQTLLNQLLAQAIITTPVLVVDGIFGAATAFAVKRAQELYFLTIDGIVGPSTWRLLFDQSNVSLPTLNIGSTGALVTKMQGRLTRNGYLLGAIDGQYGVRTKNAVRSFQVDRALTSDGVMGRMTWKALSNQVVNL